MDDNDEQEIIEGPGGLLAIPIGMLADPVALIERMQRREDFYQAMEVALITLMHQYEVTSVHVTRDGHKELVEYMQAHEIDTIHIHHAPDNESYDLFLGPADAD